MLGDYLEDEHRDAYRAWKADQTPAGNAAFLTHIKPIVDKGIKMYGAQGPLITSRARLMALEAAEKYDPTRAGLQSHILSHMRGLQRIQRQQSEIVKVPERLLLESQQLRTAAQELTDKYGREPTDDELADNLGIPHARIAQIRSFKPGYTQGQLTAMDPEYMPASHIPGEMENDTWVKLVYHDLNPQDKKIMEMTLGLNGQPIRSNEEIARLLRRSPGAISQRKLLIQQKLDQEQELSPFSGGR